MFTICKHLFQNEYGIITSVDIVKKNQDPFYLNPIHKRDIITYEYVSRPNYYFDIKVKTNKDTFNINKISSPFIDSKTLRSVIERYFFVGNKVKINKILGTFRSLDTSGFFSELSDLEIRCLSLIDKIGFTFFSAMFVGLLSVISYDIFRK